MSAEEQLREILRSEATTIVPAGDGFARIHDRVAHRRRVRLWLVPSAAVATLGITAAFFLLSPGGREPQSVDQATQGPTVSASPAPSPVAPQPPDSYQGPAYWPFASADDLGSVPDPVPAWMQDRLQVGQRLVSDVLRLQGVTVSQTCVSCEVLSLEVGGKDVGTVELGHYTVRGTRVFTVVDVTGTDLTITSPTAGTAVSSPTRVTGRIQGVDENVRVTVLAQDGTALGQGTAPAGSAVPWATNVSWIASGAAPGAVLATTGNIRDGAINRVALVPVDRRVT